jgi:hypothetical protein
MQDLIRRLKHNASIEASGDLDGCPLMANLLMEAAEELEKFSKVHINAYGEEVDTSLHTRTFRAMHSLTEAVLGSADPDFLQKRLNECIRIMKEHGWSPSVPWPSPHKVTIRDYD